MPAKGRSCDHKCMASCQHIHLVALAQAFSQMCYKSYKSHFGLPVAVGHASAIAGCNALPLIQPPVGDKLRPEYELLL